MPKKPLSKIHMLLSNLKRPLSKTMFISHHIMCSSISYCLCNHLSNMLMSEREETNGGRKEEERKNKREEEEKGRKKMRENADSLVGLLGVHLKKKLQKLH